MSLVTAFIPTFTKSLFAIEEHEPVRHLRLFLLSGQHAPDLEQCRNGRRRIVRTEKLHVLVILRIVMARDQNYCLRLTGNFADDVCHLLLTLRRGRAELVEKDVQPITLQLVCDVSACLRELRSVGRTWSKIDLLAHVVHRSFAVECSRYGRSARLARAR